MKVKDLAEKYGFDRGDIEAYIKENFIYRSGLTGMTIEDTDASRIADAFQKKLDEDHAQRLAQRERDRVEHSKQWEAERKKVEEAQQKRTALGEMMISSGFTFEGYRIKRYSEFISGDGIIHVNRGTVFDPSGATDTAKALSRSLACIRSDAINSLKEQAYKLGCNAIIGVDFDYMTMEPETASFSGGTEYLPFVFMVTANGNAVELEKIEE